MKKGLSIFTAVLVMAVLSVAGFGAVKKAAKESIFKIQGKLAAVDTAANTLTLNSKKSDVIVDVDSSTRIRIGKETKSLADLTAGEMAVIKYKNVESKKLALAINAAALKPVKSPK